MTRSSREHTLVYGKLAAFTIVAIAPAYLLSSSSHFSTLVFVTIFATVGVSLDMLLGFAGQLALGQTALFAVGAYTSAVLSTKHGVSPGLAMLASIGAAVAVAIATSPILRLRGFYFALATLALVLITQDVLSNWISVTGGASGFVGIGHFSIAGVTLTSQRDYYLFGAIVLVLAVTAGVHIRHSRFGRALLAIREDHTAAEALGISVYWAKMRIWIVASAFAGLAGVVYTYYVQFISPDQFGLGPAIQVLAAVVVGGLGGVYGAVLGVLLLWLLPELFSGIQNYAILAWGLSLIFFMVFAPGGLTGLGAQFRRFFGDRRGADAPPPPPIFGARESG
jgi:branched-chain amino acid transport system permease protein